MSTEIDRMKMLADNLERENRRAQIIQIEGGEIRDANAIVVKALRAFIDGHPPLPSQHHQSTPTTNQGE